MSFLFSGELFGIVMTMVGCMIYIQTPEFSLFRTIVAVLLTVGGIAVTLKTTRKWLLPVHALIWASALFFQVLPKPLQNLLSVIYTAALIPLVFNILRLLIRRKVGLDDNKSDGEQHD